MEIGVSPKYLTTPHLPGVSFYVNVGRSEFGTPCPTISVSLPRGGNSGSSLYRRTKATAYLLAAQVELATPRSHRWVVNIDANDGTATIALELIHGNDAEVQAAVQTLIAAVGQVGK